LKDAKQVPGSSAFHHAAFTLDRGLLLNRIAIRGEEGVSMQITFWGTRGAIPVPGMETARYGGETPCVELALSNGMTLILDASLTPARVSENLAYPFLKGASRFALPFS